MAWDFPQFYLAARTPASELYDHDAFLRRGRETLSAAGVHYFPPYVRPAVFTLPLGPLGRLPYWGAFGVWASLQLACCLVLLWALGRLWDYPPELLLGFSLFYPAMHGIWEGQDAPVLTLLVLGGLLLFRAGRDRAAGLVLAVCCYKFNLFLLMPLYLAAAGRWKLLRYVAGGGAALAAASSWLASPRAYVDYLQRIREMSVGFDASTMPGLRALSGGSAVVYAAAALGVAVLVWRAGRRLGPIEGFAVALSGSLLAAPHVAYYDLTLLIIPMGVAFRSGGRVAKAAAFILLVGVPLWLLPRYWVAGAAVALFLGLVQSLPPAPQPGSAAAPPPPTAR